MLVLPGTGARPLDYRKFAEQACLLGMHALVLSYPNETSVNSLAGEDTALHLELRKDCLDGGDRTGLVRLEPGESILERLSSALGRLAVERPEENWGQFLSGDGIDWGRVAVFGHSLGGGYAALLAMEHPLERCGTFAWSDFRRSDGRLADWLAASSDWKTPPERRFWVGHERDEILPRSVGEATADVVVPGSARAVVEAEDPPYGRARILWTDLDASREWPTAQPFHNSLVLDVESPRWPDGSFVYADLWTWLLVGRAA